MANVATTIAGLGFYAYLLTNILWLQYVWGYSVLRAGLALVPAALVAAVVAAVLGPVAERRGYRLVVVPGALVWAGAYLWYHQTTGVTPDFPVRGCPARSCPGSVSAPPCRSSAAPPWPPCRAAATRPRRRWCPAPDSWAACSASPCWSSSSAPRRPLSVVARIAAGRLDAVRSASFVLTALVVLALRVPHQAVAGPGPAEHRPAVVVPRILPELPAAAPGPVDAPCADDRSDVPVEDRRSPARPTPAGSIERSPRRLRDGAGRHVAAAARVSRPGRRSCVRGGRVQRSSSAARVVRELGPGDA